MADTDGTSPQKFTIDTSDGQPVVGAEVSWQLTDDSVESAQSYVTDANGVVEFPQVAPGSAVVQISGGNLPDGATVSGSWNTVIGTDPQTLDVAQEPAVDRRRVVVTMPNDVPVLAATVAIAGGGDARMTTSTSSGGFHFTAPGGGNPDTATGSDGVATLAGYISFNDYADQPSVPQALVEYDDGSLVQKQTVDLTDATTEVQFRYMPWVTVDAGSGITGIGSSVAVGFQVLQAGDSARLRRVSGSAASAGGDRIKITPPRGARPSDCRRRQKLSGSTSRNGRLRLRVCASRSGAYAVTSHGAVPAPPVMLFVRGAPPLAPRDALARSYSPGQVRLTWAVPAYTSGARVERYTISATAKGHKARSFTRVRPHLTVSGLSRLIRWTFHIRAVTKYGSSSPLSVVDLIS